MFRRLLIHLQNTTKSHIPSTGLTGFFIFYRGRGGRSRIKIVYFYAAEVVTIDRCECVMIRHSNFYNKNCRFCILTDIKKLQRTRLRFKSIYIRVLVGAVGVADFYGIQVAIRFFSGRLG